MFVLILSSDFYVLGQLSPKTISKGLHNQKLCGKDELVGLKINILPISVNA